MILVLCRVFRDENLSFQLAAPSGFKSNSSRQYAASAEFENFTELSDVSSVARGAGILPDAASTQL